MSEFELGLLLGVFVSWFSTTLSAVILSFGAPSMLTTLLISIISITLVIWLTGTICFYRAAKAKKGERIKLFVRSLIWPITIAVLVYVGLKEIY